jgi:hypothetical protein
MTDRLADLDAALEHVVVAARAHLEAVKMADGEPDDDAVWHAYVALNTASHANDELLNDVFGEVTPWDVEALSAQDAQGRVPTLTTVDGLDEIGPADDPYPHVLSVRQRRDYRVPSVAALLRAAEEARAPVTDEEEVLDPVETVGEAVLELLQSGDGSLGMLDLPELDPLDGVVVVAEVAAALRLDTHPESDGEAPFRLGDGERTVGRLDERSVLNLEEEFATDDS